MKNIPTLFVKKIWSDNPTKHKMITLELALEQYSQYLFTINDNGKVICAKSFKEWLKSEI